MKWYYGISLIIVSLQAMDLKFTTKESYEPLMKAVLALRYKDMKDAETQGLAELFAADGFGGKTRWGGILPIRGKIFINNFDGIINNCNYVPEEQFRRLLQDLQKDKQGVWVYMAHMPYQGLITSSLNKTTLEMYLQKCSDVKNLNRQNR